MSADPHEIDANLPLAARRHIDRLCLAFEETWQSGTRPAIAAVMEQAPEAEWSELLRELLLIDLSYVARQGQTAAAEDYQQEFPAFGAVIDAAFAAWVSGGLDSVSVRATDTTQPVVPKHVRPAVGEKLGRYLISGELGHGACGSVYLAEDSELLRQVAIKVPRSDRLAGAYDIEHFLDEARTVARLKHASIVAVYDVDRSEEGMPYIVME